MFLAFGDSDAGAPIWAEEMTKRGPIQKLGTKTYTLIAINEGKYKEGNRVPLNYYFNQWLTKIPNTAVLDFISKIIAEDHLFPEL